MSYRRVKEVVKGVSAVDGAGVHLTRVLGKPNIYDFDPFLMLDSFDSKNPDDYILGFPWHPHRGIETLTYLISGNIKHEDSLGNKGMIGDGEAQWMSAASGILHQEMPQNSEYLLGFQLWINMPSDQKMYHPSYNDLKRGEPIQTYRDDEKIVNVISGNYQGLQGFSPEYVQADVLDIEIPANTDFEYEVDPAKTLFIFTIINGVIINEEEISEKAAVLFEIGSEKVKISSTNEKARFILFSALPLKQPIAWAGPIVMNNNSEIKEAFDDLENETFIKDESYYA